MSRMPTSNTHPVRSYGRRLVPSVIQKPSISIAAACDPTAHAMHSVSCLAATTCSSQPVDPYASPLMQPAPTSPLPETSLTTLALDDGDTPSDLDLSPPSLCLQGGEPCRIMDVRRACGSAPFGVDPAANYTFERVRFSITGCNVTLTMHFKNATGHSLPMPGQVLIGFSDILTKGCCRWKLARWQKWVLEAVWDALCALVVTRVISYLPLGGILGWVLNV